MFTSGVTARAAKPGAAKSMMVWPSNRKLAPTKPAAIRASSSSARHGLLYVPAPYRGPSALTRAPRPLLQQRRSAVLPSATREEAMQQQPQVLQTDLVQVAQQVIADAQTGRRRAIFCQGLSEKGIEACIANAWYPRDPVAFDVPGVPGVKLLISPGMPYHLPDYRPYRPLVTLDVNQQLIAISVTARLAFVNPQNLREVYAYAYAKFTVTAQPQLAIGASSTLQFKFRTAEIVLGPIYDVQVADRIDQLFGGVAAFRNKVTEIVNSLRDRQAQFAGTLPAYVESRAMPDNWNQVQGYELSFVKMDYRQVAVDGTPIGYLFLVFSVKSLMLPAPCFCETAGLKAEQGAVQQDQRPNRRSRLMDPFNEELLAEEEKRYGIMSFSQEALAEIAKPQAEIGQAESVSTGGTIYGRAQYWYKTTFADLRVLQDGISAEVAFTADGSLKAAVRDKCDNDVVSAFSKLRFRYDPSTVKWSLSLVEEPDPDTPTKKRKRLLATAAANMGRLSISIESNVPPINTPQITSWVVTKLVDLLDSRVEKAIADKATFTLVTHDNSKNDYLLLELKAIQGIPDKSLHVIVDIRPVH